MSLAVYNLHSTLNLENIYKYNESITILHLNLTRNRWTEFAQAVHPPRVIYNKIHRRTLKNTTQEDIRKYLITEMTLYMITCDVIIYGDSSCLGLSVYPHGFRGTPVLVCYAV